MHTYCRKQDIRKIVLDHIKVGKRPFLPHQSLCILLFVCFLSIFLCGKLVCSHILSEWKDNKPFVQLTDERDLWARAIAGNYVHRYIYTIIVLAKSDTEPNDSTWNCKQFNKWIVSVKLFAWHLMAKPSDMATRENWLWLKLDQLQFVKNDDKSSEFRGSGQRNEKKKNEIQPLNVDAPNHVCALKWAARGMCQLRCRFNMCTLQMRHSKWKSSEF